MYLINIKYSTCSNFAHYQLTAYIKKALSHSTYKNSNLKIIYNIYFYTQNLIFSFMEQTFIVHLACARVQFWTKQKWLLAEWNVGTSKNDLTSVQSLSHVWLFVTPWTAAHQASPSITNSPSLLKLMSIESVMPSNHLILCRPLLLRPSVFPSIRVFSNESIPCIKWPKYWSFSFNISLSNEYSGLISFRLLLLLLSRFSRVQLCATPETATHQAPLSLGLSRQEHWSGLPFPSPMHESEKWKWSH